MLEQPLLAVHASGVFANGAAGGNDAMARNDNAQRILIHSRADGSCSTVMPRCFREFPVGDGLAEGDFHEVLPDGLLKISRAEHQRQ